MDEKSLWRWKCDVVVVVVDDIRLPSCLSSSVPKNRDESFQFDLHFASQRISCSSTFHVCRITAFAFALKRDEHHRYTHLVEMDGWEDPTFENLHLLFGNHAWICVYLYSYFAFSYRNCVSLSARTRKWRQKSAEMFISKTSHLCDCDDDVFIFPTRLRLHFIRVRMYKHLRTWHETVVDYREGNSIQFDKTQRSWQSRIFLF